MSNQTFLNISAKKCLVVYPKIIENSDRKWETALLSANSEDYGTAVALLIISVEELIKGLIILLDGKGFKFRNVNGIKKIFEDHKTRYFIALTMTLLNIFSNELQKFLTDFSKRPDKWIKLVAILNKKPKFFERIASSYIETKLIEINNELKWFSNVDVYRQHGFYSDYKKELISPMSITNMEYLETLEKFRKIRFLGKSLIVALNPIEPAYIEVFKYIKHEFDSKNYYQKAEIILKKTNNKYSLFNMLSNALQPHHQEGKP